MDPKDVVKLRVMRNELRSQLQFIPISTQLLQTELITQEEYQQIISRVTEPDQIDLLLDILPSKGLESFNSFTTVLNKEYPWLAKALMEQAAPNQMDNKESRDICKLNQVITVEMMRMIRHNHRVARGWTSLAHALDLSRQLNNIRVRVMVFNEDSDMCVLYLLQEWVGQKAQEATLNKLLLALREESFNDVADELEATFA